MTESDLKFFLNGVMMICAVMAIFNLARYKKRGASAYLLGAAFLDLGLTAYAYNRHAPMAVLVMGGFVLFGLLAADMLFRMGVRK